MESIKFNLISISSYHLTSVRRVLVMKVPPPIWVPGGRGEVIGHAVVRDGSVIILVALAHASRAKPHWVQCAKRSKCSVAEQPHAERWVGGSNPPAPLLCFFFLFFLAEACWWFLRVPPQHVRGSKTSPREKLECCSTGLQNCNFFFQGLFTTTYMLQHTYYTYYTII